MAVAAGLVGKIGAVFAVMIAVQIGAAEARCADPFAIRPPEGAVAFTQTRHLSGARVPLVSRGEAQVAPERVEWRVTQPIEVLTVLSPGGITQSVEGAPAQAVGPEGAGFLSSTGLAAILSGDFEGARANYDIAQSAAPNGDWILRLTPRADSMRRFISVIEVGGCDAVESVSVRQASGDRTDIEFASP